MVYDRSSLFALYITCFNNELHFDKHQLSCRLLSCSLLQNYVPFIEFVAVTSIFRSMIY